MDTFTERFNPENLNYIIENWKQISQKINFDEKSPKETLAMMKKYLEKSRHGVVRTRYRQVGEGRWYAVFDPSLQGLKKEIRAAIASEFYVDIDMKNAHPVILSHICKQENIPCPKLDLYIQKRDIILKAMKLERAKAKQIWLSLMNGGLKDYRENRDKLSPKVVKLLDNFKTEAVRIHNILAEKYNEKYEQEVAQREKENKDYNHKASFMNKLLCEIENKILMKIWKFFGRPTECVFCFDGIMLPKGSYDLAACSEYIKEKLDIEIGLEEKPFCEAIKIPANLPKYQYKSLEYFIDVYNLIREPEEKPIYREFIEEWVEKTITLIVNKQRHFLVKELEINDGQEEVIQDVRTVAEVLGSAKLSTHYYNPKFDKDFHQKNKDLAKSNPVWKDIRMKKVIYTTLTAELKNMLKLGKIKKFAKADYRAYLERLGQPELYKTYNLFTGFPLENANIPGGIDFENSLMYRHLRDIICNGNKGEFMHFLDHLTDIIQDPDTLKPVAHLFYSEQGVGKGAMLFWFSKLIGDSNVTTIINTERYLKNSFNAHSTFKLLKVFEEVAEKGASYRCFNQLKGEIASPHENCEQKGINAFKVKNVARYWFFTNNENALFIEGDDRRYTLHKCNNKYADDETYFEPLWEEIMEPANQKAAFEYFANRKYNKGNARKCYTNDYKQSQKLHNLPSGIRFIIDFLEEKFNNVVLSNLKPADCRIAVSELRSEYPGNIQTLATQLRKLGFEARKLRCSGYPNPVKCFDLPPAIVENSLQKYLRNPNFKLNFEAESAIDEFDNVN